MGHRLLNGTKNNIVLQFPLNLMCINHLYYIIGWVKAVLILFSFFFFFFFFFKSPIEFWRDYLVTKFQHQHYVYSFSYIIFHTRDGVQAAFLTRPCWPNYRKIPHAISALVCFWSLIFVLKNDTWPEFSVIKITRMMWQLFIW